MDLENPIKQTDHTELILIEADKMDRLEAATRELSPKNIHWLWLTSILVFLVMVAVVAPGRGAAWFEDEGFHLIRSWDAANGYGFDKMIPQDPSYLFNALLMKVGLLELLHFRYVTHILSFLSAAVFFVGMDDRRLLSPIVPVAVCGSLFMSLTSISTPGSLSLAFFMVGAGFLFFAIDTTQRRRFAFSALSGFFLALAGFMHAGVAIAMICLIGIAFLIDSPLGRTTLAPSFVLFCFLLWGCYIYWIGIDSLLTQPAAHDSSASYISNRLLLILMFFMEAALAYAVTTLCFVWLGHGMFAAAQGALSLVITLFYGATLLAYAVQLPSPSPWLEKPQFTYLLTGDSQFVSRIPGAAMYLLCFCILRWVGETWYPNIRLSAMSLLARFSSKGISRDRPFSVSAGRMFNFNAQNRKYVIAVAGLVLVPIALAVGSASDVFQIFAICAGPIAGVAIIMCNSFGRSGSIFVLPSIAWIGILGTFALTYNHSNNESIFSPGRLMLNDAPLRGIMVQPGYAIAVAQLREAYQANDCRPLTMMPLDYIPLVHYILQHPVPNSFGVVRPHFYFPEDRIRAELTFQRGWCVLDVTGTETRGSISGNHGIDKRASLRAWVVENSDRAAKISSPSPDLSDIVLYVRDARPKQPDLPLSE